MRQNTVGIYMGFSVLLLVLLSVFANAFTSDVFATEPSDAYYEWDADSEYRESGDQTNVDEYEYVEKEYSEEYGDQPEERGGEHEGAPPDVQQKPVPPTPHKEVPPPALLRK